MAEAGAEAALAVEKIAGEHGGFPVEVPADHELGGFAASGQGGADIGYLSRASQQFFLPVGIAVRIPGAVDVIGSGRVFRDAVVGESLGAHGQVLAGVHQLHEARDFAVSFGGVQGKGGFSGPAFFGGDQHDPVGPARSVDGRGVGIFQDLQALDVSGVQAVQRAGGGRLDGIGLAQADRLGGVRHPVDDEKGRVAVGAQAVDASDLDVKAAPCGSRILGNADTGHPAMHRGQGIIYRLGGDVFGADGGDAAGALPVIDRIVARIDGDFLQVSAVRDEQGVDDGLVFDSDFKRSKAQVGKDEDVSR